MSSPDEPPKWRGAGLAVIERRHACRTKPKKMNLLSANRCAPHNTCGAFRHAIAIAYHVGMFLARYVHDVEDRMNRIVVMCCLFCGACVMSNAPPSQPMGGPPPAVPAAGSGSLSTRDVEGFWTGDWGQLVFKQKAGKLFAVYNHDEGTITGTIVDGKFVGWWCEAPSRKPNHDAGDVEMKFITDGAGKRAIDGRWRYGASQDWHEDWDIAFDPGVPDANLVKRFDDPAAFCDKPAP